MSKFKLFKAFFIVLAVLTLESGTIFATEENQGIFIEDSTEIAGILPSNPFYFLKEFGWGIKRFLTFDAIRKIELELKIVDQQILELKKLSGFSANDELILSALKNYQDSMARLEDKINALKATSGNPIIDKLLDRVASIAIRSQDLIINLEDKNSDLKDELDLARFEVNEVVSAIASKDSPEKLSERLEKALKKHNPVMEKEPVEIISTEEVIEPEQEVLK